MKENMILKKQIESAMFTEKDIEKSTNIAQENNAQKIYIVGNVGSGKSTFGLKLSQKLGYKNIDLDFYNKEYCETNSVSSVADIKDLLDFVLQKEKPPFVINHADILKRGSAITDENADMIVFLNPNKEELLKNRESRLARGASGDWINIKPENYDKIEKDNLEELNKLKGNIVYKNNESSTIIKIVK